MDILHIILLVVITIVIICILGNVIYSKSMMLNEGFGDATTTKGATTTTSAPSSTPTKPDRVRIIRISDSQFQVHFHYGNLSNITKFIIVLTQYDNQSNIVGEIKMIASDETPSSGGSMCSSAGAGLGNKCGFAHTFSNVSKLDDDNNNYLYRVGVAAIDNNGNISEFAEPDNVPILAGKRLFTMEKDFKLSTGNLTTSAGAVATSNISAAPNTDFLNEGIDSQYNLLSKQLGGYPYNAVLSSSSAKQNSLADLVGQSMADGIVNVQLS